MLKMIHFLVLNTFICFYLLQAHAQYKGLGVESVSQEQLKKYSPPVLDVNRVNQLKKMFDVSSPGMGMLSPNKKTLYFSWRVTGITQLWKVDAPKGFPVQLTSGNDEVRLDEVAPNGQFLIISKDLNGQENPGLYKLDLKSGLIEELYRKPKVQAKFAFLTDDSSTLFFAANDKSPESYSIYKMNLLSKKVETIYDGQGPWFVADYKNNGKNILLVKYSGAKQNEYFDLDTNTKELRPIIGQNEKEEYEVSYGAKPNQYIVLSNKNTDFKKLYLLTLNPSGENATQSNKLQLISPEMNYEISGFSVDQLRKRIIYNINRDGYSEISVIDAKTLKPISLPKFPSVMGAKVDHLINGVTTRDGEFTMFGVITSQAPRLSYSYDWKNKKFTQWVLPSTPEVDLTKFVPAELMHYESRDHVKIPMFVRFPEGCKPTLTNRKKCSVVVHFHGGPEGQSQPGFSVTAQSFVEEQFIFVEPNVRGSDGYGRKWIEMDNGPLRENVITDIEDAALWIKQNWKYSDGTTPKVGVMGGSYGGYSTLLAMTRFAGAYEAGAAIVGMSNLISFLNNTAPYRRILRISEYGDPVKDKEALIKLSPITYVDRVKAPLLVIQGANDPRVPAGEAIQIQETLSKKGIDSKLILFADEGHGAAKKDNQVLEIGHILEFFKKHLN